jgi:type I restriction enzyme S subunit
MEVKALHYAINLGILPNDWRLRPLAEIGKWYSGGTPSMSNAAYWSGEIPWVSPKDMKTPRLYDAIDHISPEAVTDGARLLPKGTVLMVIRGMILAHSFPVARAERPLAFNQDMKAVVTNDEFDSDFVLHWLIGNAQRLRCLATESTHGTKRLPPETLFRVPFPQPTKPEQEAIAGALTDADALIESLEQLVAKKRQIKHGAMQELLTGKKRLPGFEIKSGYKHTDVGAIPEDWEAKTIEQISMVGRGRVISHKEIARSLSPRYPVYSSQTSNNGIMGYLDTFEFEGEYITWTTDGANAGTVFYRHGRFNCTNVCGTIKLKSDNHVFVANVLGSFAPRHVSRHLGNPKLMNDIMKRVKIPLPPTKTEQEAIAAILTDMDAEIAALEAKRAKARQIKQGMMQELLTGRIRLI